MSRSLHPAFTLEDDDDDDHDDTAPRSGSSRVLPMPETMEGTCDEWAYETSVAMGFVLTVSMLGVELWVFWNEFLHAVPLLLLICVQVVAVAWTAYYTWQAFRAYHRWNSEWHLAAMPMPLLTTWLATIPFLAGMLIIFTRAAGFDVVDAFRRMSANDQAQLWVMVVLCVLLTGCGFASFYFNYKYAFGYQLVIQTQRRRTRKMEEAARRALEQQHAQLKEAASRMIGPSTALTATLPNFAPAAVPIEDPNVAAQRAHGSYDYSAVLTRMAVADGKRD